MQESERERRPEQTGVLEDTTFEFVEDVRTRRKVIGIVGDKNAILSVVDFVTWEPDFSI